MFGIFKKKEKYGTRPLTAGIEHRRLGAMHEDAVRQVQDSRREDVYELLLSITDLRSGVTIRRINPKQSGNLWSVQYLNGRKYYGAGLLEALNKLDKDKAYQAKIAREMRKAVELEAQGEDKNG